MRYRSKRDLVDDIEGEHERLWSLLDDIAPARYEEAGVWGDGWSLKDLVAHLAEWQRMFLGWYEAGQEGREPDMPAPGYRWNETPRLNREIRARHADASWAEVRADFDAGYRRILALVDEVPEEGLLTPGHFPWTGKYPLTTYLGPNTASHYRFAIKVIRRWARGRRVSTRGDG